MVIQTERLRVLVVDDEKNIADSLAMIFRVKGFDACAAYSGESALKEADRMRPNVLISDVVMRGMNGFETALEIMRMFPGCRVLLISGQAVTMDLMQTADAKNCKFEILNKPVPPQTLIDYLERCA